MKYIIELTTSEYIILYKELIHYDGYLKTLKIYDKICNMLYSIMCNRVFLCIRIELNKQESYLLYKILNDMDYINEFVSTLRTELKNKIFVKRGVFQ